MVWQLIIASLAMGIVYGMVAMGMVLIWRAVGVVNFAQGEFLMLGAFAAYTLTLQLGLPQGAALATCALLMGLVGVVYHFITYWPLRKSWDITVIISTIGASIALKEVATLVWGPAPLAVDPIVHGIAKLGEAAIEWQFIVTIGVAALLMAAIFILLERTYLGHILQAAAQDQYAAAMIGIPVVLATGLTFAISALITGVGGMLLAPLFFVTTTMGGITGLKAFAAVIIGGFGSVQGAIIGGILIGFVDTFAGAYISTTYRDAIVFLCLILALVVRPQGIFGEKIAEKV
ncbi:MAG: branched-chain amino acid transporter permease [Anaerosporomusa subterranea]|jgi:branched-chain amino acid transport system permease protein|nr:branched-chain amino acid transporter permease [Anaerosporomusa subterranea]